MNSGDIGYPLPGSVGFTPKLKVFYPIIVTDSVDVVNRFVREQAATEVTRHNVAMLWHKRTTATSGFTCWAIRIVQGDKDTYVTT